MTYDVVYSDPCDRAREETFSSAEAALARARELKLWSDIWIGAEWLMKVSPSGGDRAA